MAKIQFEDDAGRPAWLDEQSGIVYTEGGKNSTNLTLDKWNERQVKKWGAKGSSKTTKSPYEEYVDSAMSSVKQQIKDQTKFIEKYTKSNPFAFDENLAKESATAEYEPYYNQILNDYLTDIKSRRETIQDDKVLSTTLKKMDDVTTNRSFVDAVQKTREGFAGRGLYDSGFQMTAEGRSTVDYQDTQQRADLGYQHTQGDYGRDLTYLDTLSARKERDVADEKKAAIESGVLQRENEQIKAYNVPFTQAYQRAFGNSGTSVLDGYLVPEALRY